MKDYFVPTYNTMSGVWVNVPVSKELYEEYRRSAWAIENNDRKHVKNTVLFSDLEGHAALDRYECFSDDTLDPGYIDFESLLDERLEIAIASLEQDEQDLVFALFFSHRTLKAYGEEIGLKKDAVAYRRDKVIKKLKEILKNDEEIY